MKPLLKRLMLLGGALLIGANGFAQGQSNETPSPGSTPTNKGASAVVAGAASGLYNVNLYDGTAGINIPIYDYTIAGLSLGVSLGYDTHGIRVDQVASPVGLGWGLSASGSITRKVNGIEDELTWKDNKACGAWMSTSDYPDKQYDEFYATFAGRSIRFSISVESSQKISVKTYPVSDIKVSMWTEDMYSPIDGSKYVFYRSNRKLDHQEQLAFEIIDERNNRFYFRQGNTVERYQEDSLTLAHRYLQADNWNLVRVITHSNDTVKYTYEAFEDISYPEYKNELVREVDQDINWGGSRADEPRGVRIVKNEMRKWNGTIMQLSQIEYPNGTKVNFSSDDHSRCDLFNAKPIERITISQKIDDHVANVLAYKLNFSYFHAPYAGNTDPEVEFGSGPPFSCIPCLGLYALPGLPMDVAYNEMQSGLRLKLKSIEKIGADNVTKEPYYSFSYNTTSLPKRLSPSKDFYGYYNGQTPVNPNGHIDLAGLSITKHTFTAPGFSVTYGVNKSPNFSLAKAGILGKITNAGGGTIELYYKDHVLANPVNGYIGSNYFGNTVPDIILPNNYEGEDANDGLCIDKIIVKDGVSPDHTVIEEYVFSGGERFFRGGFSWYADAADYSGQNQSIGGVIIGRFYLASFVSPMQFINGSNHGYTHAEVKRTGYNNQFLGSTKYDFTNVMAAGSPLHSNIEMIRDQNYSLHNSNFLDAIKIRNYANDLPPSAFYEYRMGKPLNVYHFDQNNNLTAKTTYTYLDSGRTEKYKYRLADYGSFTSSVGNMWLPPKSYHSFIAMPYLLVNQTEVQYLSNGLFTTSTDYTYTPTFDINTVKSTDALGREVTKKFTYSILSDRFYRGSTRGIYGVPATTLFDYNLPQGHIISKNINGTDYCIGTNKTIYQGQVAGQNGVTHNYQNKSKSYGLYNENPVPLSSYPAGEQVISEIIKRDSHNNVLEVKHEDQERYSAAIWDTRIGKKIAAVSNARYDEIAYTSFEGTTFAAPGTPDDNKGNWEFDPAYVVYNPAMTTSGAMTGKYHYSLTGTRNITSSKLTVQGKKYILTMWADALPQVTTSSQGLLLTEQMQIGNWKLYTAIFTGDGAALTVGATGTVKLDELRLYPADATMTTTTYEPLFGPGSVCDERNNINYIEYDAMGRQAATRDINRFILSASKTVVSGADN